MNIKLLKNYIYFKVIVINEYEIIKKEKNINKILKVYIHKF